MPNNDSDLDEANRRRAKEPDQALNIDNRYIAANPDDPQGYFSRALTWCRLGEYARALDDCNRSLDLGPHWIMHRRRSDIHRHLGDYPKALADQNHLHDAHYDEWLTSFGPHMRADTLARLGRLDDALADCALIPDDHWMPAHDGLPGGDKAQFIAEIRQRAAAAERR